MIARKLAELFSFTHNVRTFYAACCFDELSRGSVSCLFNASFEKRFPQRHNSILYAKIDDHGVRRDDTGQRLACSRRPVASRVALDLPYWAMRSASYRLIRMAIEMASEVGAFFSVVDFLSRITVAKRPCYGPLKIKRSYYCSLICINVVYILWRPADSNECRFGYHCRRQTSEYCNLQRGSKMN